MPYFKPYFDEAGFHMPTYLDVMEYLTTGYKQIFGEDVYLEPDSQDYQLLSLYARAWDDLQAVMLETYNARNPNFATGEALDLLLPLSGIRRHPASRSVVELYLSGNPGTNLGAGVMAMDAKEHTWSTISAVTFDETGHAVVMARCNDPGRIHAEAGTINSIHTPVYNWVAVTNLIPATPGRDVETDAQVRVRRAMSVAQPSRSILDGIRDGLVNLDGVTKVRVVENNTGDVDANGIPGHSICAVVAGGEDADIARVLYQKKAPGIGTHGDVSAVYVDTYGQNNTLKFYRQQENAVTVTINLRRLNGWDGTKMEDVLKSAVSDYISSIQIGDDLVVPMLYNACYQANIGSVPTFAITSIKARTSGHPDTSDTIHPAFNEELTVASVSIVYAEG